MLTARGMLRPKQVCLRKGGLIVSSRSRVPHLGESFLRQDAPAKVTGRERYAADYYAPDMLWAGVRQAGVPHARLKAVRTEAARAVPGVVAVLTHRDIEGSNRQGVVRRDQPVLVDDKVRHCGDAVALVVAEDPQALARGIAAVELELEPLPGVFDPEEALHPEAPLVHEDHPHGNLLLEGHLVKGQGEAALADCEVVVEATYHLPRQEHAYLETECGWAVLENDGTLKITASTQTPFRDRAEVAEALGLELERVRVVAPFLGGGFGGKDGVSVQSLLGLAALACPGRPVKMWLSREESFLASPKRHPVRIRCRLGADRRGRLQALVVDALYDTGPYDHLGGVVMTLGLEHAGGPYRIPHAELHTRAVYTNNPVSGAFRGFGVPQVVAALELTLDRLARRLELDPLELRRRNLLRPGEQSPAMVSMPRAMGLAECLERVSTHPLWAQRRQWKAAAPRHRLRGVGLAVVMHAVGYGPVVPDEGRAVLEMDPEGRLRVYCGVADMGQGNASTYLHIGAHLLHQPVEGMELVMPDTARTLPSGSSSASRTTFTFGVALAEAAHELKARLLVRAAARLGAEPGELELAPGVVRARDGRAEVPLAELVRDLSPEERRVETYHRAPVSQERPSDDPALQLHGLPHCVYSFGVQVAAVEVDRLTGQVEVRGFLTVCDAGRVLNPQLLEQQVQGGVAQGLGYALWEDMPSEEGRIQTPDLATYLVPTALDLPDMETLTVETFEEAGPFGAKGLGEMPTGGVLPAVGAAVADACGLEAVVYPLTPERVLMALEESRAA